MIDCNASLYGLCYPCCCKYTASLHYGTIEMCYGTTYFVFWYFPLLKVA